MVINKIEYHQFRNIQSAVILPSDGANLLYGSNAQGKTNAVEGIYLFAYGRSFRGVRDKEMICSGASYSCVSMSYTDKCRTNLLQISFDAAGRRIFKKNGVNITKLSEFVGSFRAVLFCPEHLQIVKASPSERRAFLDNALIQISAGYIRNLQNYYTVLFQRNAVLKKMLLTGSADPSLETWSQQLASAAVLVTAERCAYLERISGYAGMVFDGISGGKECLTLIYEKPLSHQEYLSLYTAQEMVRRDIKYGATQTGPHRDDIRILLNEKDSKIFASQGQQRTVALALKLAEGEMSREATGEYPVFLFDDIFSELDHVRREYIFRSFQDKNKQVFFTGCDLQCSPYAKNILVSEGSFWEQ